MILAIGIVVDDAIVVVEAVHAKLDEAKSGKEATISAMNEITGAIVSITSNGGSIYSVSFLSGPSSILPTICYHFSDCYFNFGGKCLDFKSCFMCVAIKTTSSSTISANFKRDR
jgi:hypothetical protein